RCRQRLRLLDEVRSHRREAGGRGRHPVVLAVRAHPRRLRSQPQPPEGRRFRRGQLLGRFTVLGGGMKGIFAALLILAGASLAGSPAANPQAPRAPPTAPPPAAPPLAAPPSAAPSGVRMAYIDVQRVLTRSAAGVAAREALEKDRASMQKEMDGKRQELEKI